MLSPSLPCPRIQARVALGAKRLAVVGRPAVIQRDRVAEVTLQLIDDEGIEAVSIERIAKMLGVKGPSLYHHFADKAEILTSVAELVLGDLDMDRPTLDWQDWMVETSLILFERVVAHPPGHGAAAVHAGRADDQWSGRAAQMMTEAGVDPAVQVLIMEGTEKMIWGWALQRAVTHSDRLDPTIIANKWPQLATAVRKSRWNDVQLVTVSLRVVPGRGARRPFRTRRLASLTSAWAAVQQRSSTGRRACCDVLP